MSLKKKGLSLDVFSSVNKSVVIFKADFYCATNAIFIATFPANGDPRTFCSGRENI